MKFKIPEELNFIEVGRLPQKYTTESMIGKLCLVTGATSGVGYYGAKELAKSGAEIILIARNKEKAESVSREIEEINGKKTSYYLADFKNLNEVKAVTEAIKRDFSHLDVLVNSAGIHNTKKEYTEAGLEAVFSVNHLSSFLITREMIPLLKKRPGSRIVQINSEGHRFGNIHLDDLNWEKRIYTGLRSYGASKTAQLLCTWEFNDLLKDTGITINAMHPGAVRTNIGNNNGWLYRFYLHNILWHFLKEPEIAGNAVYYLAAAGELQDTSGVFFNLTNIEIPAKHSRDRVLSKEIFRISDELTSMT